MAEIKVPLPTNAQMEEIINKTPYEQASDSIKVKVINEITSNINNPTKDFVLICDRDYANITAGETISLSLIDTTIYKEIDLLIFNSMDSGVPEPVQISLRQRENQLGFFSYIESGVYSPFYRKEISSDATTWFSFSQMYPDVKKITTTQLEILLRYANQPTSGSLKIFLIGER